MAHGKHLRVGVNMAYSLTHFVRQITFRGVCVFDTHAELAIAIAMAAPADDAPARNSGAYYMPEHALDFSVYRPAPRGLDPRQESVLRTFIMFTAFVVRLSDGRVLSREYYAFMDVLTGAK